MTSSTEPVPFDPATIERPAPQMLSYGMLCSFLTGPGVFIALPAIMIRYYTLRYQFDETGIRSSVGLIFRHESITAYRRIQDIHVQSNIIQRWFGISTVSIHTASGNSGPEIAIEGVANPEQLRDWLYERLRGAKSNPIAGTQTSDTTASDSSGTPSSATPNADASETNRLLREIRDNLATLARKHSDPSNASTTDNAGDRSI